LGALGLLGAGRTYGVLALAVGDRVICRQNDRGLDVDNGMRGTVRELDGHRAVIETDAGAVRELPAAYVDEHVEHAYALTGHSMQGGTVERAIVVASPRDLTAGWSYTALSRARGETRILIVDADENERSEFAPSGSTVAREPCLARIARRMLERDDEDLALERFRREHPERAAERAEPRVPRRTRQRLENLHVRVARLTSERERIAQRLDALPRPHRRLVRSQDPDAVERAHLAKVLEALTGELQAAARVRQRLGPESRDPRQATPKDDPARAAAELARERGRGDPTRREVQHERSRGLMRNRDADLGRNP
jgi:hypothetical protein